MAVMVLIGARWGDKGKGKATDLYGERVATRATRRGWTYCVYVFRASTASGTSANLSSG